MPFTDTDPFGGPGGTRTLKHAVLSGAPMPIRVLDHMVGRDRFERSPLPPWAACNITPATDVKLVGPAGFEPATLSTGMQACNITPETVGGVGGS